VTHTERETRGLVPVDDTSITILPLSIKSGQLHRCRSGCARPRSPLAPRCVHMRARKSPHHGVAVFCMPLSSPNGAGSSPEPATGVHRGDCPDEGRDHRRPVNGVGNVQAPSSRSPSRSRPPTRWSAASPGCKYLRTMRNAGGSPPGPGAVGRRSARRVRQSGWPPPSTPARPGPALPRPRPGTPRNPPCSTPGH
jgi:hypothetical protein